MCVCECIVYFTELTNPFEDAIEEVFERKKLKKRMKVEIGVRGFVAKST